MTEISGVVGEASTPEVTSEGAQMVLGSLRHSGTSNVGQKWQTPFLER